MAKKGKVQQLEGEALLERLGHMALERTTGPFRAKRIEVKDGKVHCGFRFQQEVLIGALSWETVKAEQHIRLEVFSINPQTGNLDLRLAHDFKEDV
jgi:hypothetical protein